jgi:hypothetical protein
VDHGRLSSNNSLVVGLLSNKYEILSSILLSSLTPHAEKLMATITVDFDVTGQLLIVHSTFVKYLKNKLG